MGANRVSKKYWKKQSGVVSLVDASDSASVGVDDSGQGAKFEVYEDGSDAELLIHEDAGTQEARLHLRRGTRDWEIINNANLSFEVETSEVLELDNSGNLTLKNNTGYRMEDSGSTVRNVAKIDGSDVQTFGDSNVTSVFATDVKARAYPASDEANLTDETWRTITLDTETYDLGNNFDATTNYDFTAPVAGYYIVNAQVTWRNTSIVANRRYQVRIYNGASALAQNSGQTATTQHLSMPIHDIVKLSASDTIVLQAWHSTGTNTQDVIGNGVFTYMSVHLCSVD